MLDSLDTTICVTCEALSGQSQTPTEKALYLFTIQSIFSGFGGDTKAKFLRDMEGCQLYYR
jgi:hypothetical protein